MRLDRLIQRCRLGIAGMVGLSWLRFARCRAALGHQLTLRLAIYAGNTSLELGQTDQRLVQSKKSTASRRGVAYMRGVRLRSRPLTQAAVSPVGETLRLPHASVH
jgi:hypothetical protein